MAKANSTSPTQAKDIPRNTNLDLIRTFALLMVLTVHTFLNNGYYSTPVTTPAAIAGTCVRQFAMVCVPLFLLLTGYLQGTKELTLSKKYLCKLTKVLVPYAIITVLTYGVMHLTGGLGDRTFLSMLLGCEDNGYSWYIEMYVGLYLLMPFLNAGWRHLPDKSAKSKVILAFLVVSFAPTLIRPFGISVPDYWTYLYPLAYYLTGAYLREYGLSFTSKRCAIIVAWSSALHFAMAIAFFRDDMFSPNNGYNNLFCFINAVMVFTIMLRIDTNKMKERNRKFWAMVADAVLPAYLVSYITDAFLYTVWCSLIPSVDGRIIFAAPVILVSAIVSLCVGLGISKTSRLARKLFVKTVKIRQIKSHTKNLLRRIQHG